MLRSLAGCARRTANRARELHSARGSLADDSPQKIVAVLYAAGDPYRVLVTAVAGRWSHALVPATCMYQPQSDGTCPSTWLDPMLLASRLRSQECPVHSGPS